MDTGSIIGLLAAVFTTAANIPQTYVIIRDKSTQHLSAVTYGILFTGTFLWVVYGVINNDWPIILSNGISTLTSAIIITLHFSTQRTINKIHQSVLPKKIREEAKQNAKGKKGK